MKTNVNRVLHLYWRTKKKRVRKKNLTRFGKWMNEQGEAAIQASVLQLIPAESVQQ